MAKEPENFHPIQPFSFTRAKDVESIVHAVSNDGSNTFHMMNTLDFFSLKTLSLDNKNKKIIPTL